VSAEKPKLVWVAGVGASLGLGAALARRFAKAGFSAVVTGRNATRLEVVAAEIRASGGSAVALAGDVSRESDVLGIAQGPQGIHVAHVVIDGGIDGERLRSRNAERVALAGPDGLLHPDATLRAARAV
jgi:NADP-dependent 3-hydroxy acid dehydrogenase YdfG